MVNLFRSEVDKDCRPIAKNFISHIFIINKEFYILGNVGSQSCMFINLDDGRRWNDSFDNETPFEEMESMVAFEYLGKCDIEIFQREQQI